MFLKKEGKKGVKFTVVTDRYRWVDEALVQCRRSFV